MTNQKPRQTQQYFVVSVPSPPPGIENPSARSDFPAILWRLLTICLSFWLSTPNFTVRAQTAVLTYHNDISRTGENTFETILTPANVNSTQFGKLFSHKVDGGIYAQPLYVPQLDILGRGIHNVVFVATQMDTLYAFDADSNLGANAHPLWQVSLIDNLHGGAPGETPVNIPGELRCTAIIPQVGITSTPVIDPIGGTIFVETFSKQGASFVHRLHSIHITDGSEKPGSPVAISATISRAGKSSLSFDALHQLNRPGLLLLNGIVYLAYGSHCDRPPYYGWVFAYHAASLAQVGKFVTAPTYGKAGVWMSGAGLAADKEGSLFVAVGDGWFDSKNIPPQDLGNSIIKIAVSRGKLALLDYFTPFNQQSFARHDGDLGSGGVLLLPDQPGSHPHLLVEVGKEGTLYLLDRDAMTAKNLHYCAGCSSDQQIVQELFQVIDGGVWGMPAYWNNTIYVSGTHDVLRAFSLKNGRVSSAPISASQDICPYPGCALSISANGNLDAILWALEASSDDVGGPAVLKAYDAANLGSLLYSSQQRSSRDDPGPAIKFATPTVINGKVYTGAAGQLTVFGLLPQL